MSDRSDRASIRTEIISLALPNIVSQMSTPLISLVDSFVAGHLDGQNGHDGHDGHATSGVALSAIAVGVSNFLLTYNMFIFLRKGTTGLTAQARGG